MLQEESMILFGHPYYHHHAIPLSLSTISTTSTSPNHDISRRSRSNSIKKSSENSLTGIYSPQDLFLSSPTTVSSSSSLLSWPLSLFSFGKPSVDPEREMIQYYRENAMKLFTTVMEQVRRQTVKAMFMNCK